MASTGSFSSYTTSVEDLKQAEIARLQEAIRSVSCNGLLRENHNKKDSFISGCGANSL